jgi:cytochrome c peroxidase
MNTRSVTMMALLASIGGCMLETGGADSASTGAGAGTDATDSTDSTNGTVESAELDTVVARRCDDRNHLANHVPVADATGAFTTVSSQGSIDLDNEFFQDLGTNGRRCVSCHVPTVGWTITPHQLRTVFDATDGGKFEDGLGLSAVFRTNDGANSPRADVSTLARRRQAYSMLLDKGLVRVGLAVPANAEFELVAVDDPYHFASAAELSLFRRPLPTTNLKFDSTVMWDGREVVPGHTVTSELLTQASDAVMGHAQGQPLTAAQRQSIVDFELSLASAQITDRDAGSLHADGAKGGPDEILAQEFHVGVNDNFGDSQTGAPFSPMVFTIFNDWADLAGRGNGRRGHGNQEGYGRGHGDDRDHDSDGHGRDDRRVDEARASIARGQAIFNSHKIVISGVSGINDEAAFGKPASITGTCSTCHDTPNGGNHSVVAPLNIGLTDASRRTRDLPLYTLRNKTTGETVQVTDPGRAMVDGKWSHIGRFKGPMLRNLAPRAPYFHNGFAADLDAAVDFYDTRFHIGFTRQDKADLVAFLRSL